MIAMAFYLLFISSVVFAVVMNKKLSQSLL